MGVLVVMTRGDHGSSILLNNTVLHRPICYSMSSGPDDLDEKRATYNMLAAGQAPIGICSVHGE